MSDPHSHSDPKDTPRTDAAWKEHYHLAGDGKVMSFAYRLAEEMRKLERELASLRPEHGEQAKRLADIADYMEQLENFDDALFLRGLAGVCATECSSSGDVHGT